MDNKPMNVVGSTTTQIRTGTNRIFRQSGMPPAGAGSQPTSQESRHDPIGLTKTLWEVKNVTGTLYYTQQLQDYVTFAKANGYTFTLWVKQGTELSGPLQEAVANKQIILKYIPGSWQGLK